ncbi:MAG: M16 family metallopeptidase [Flavobacteriaceae bacterium]
MRRRPAAQCARLALLAVALLFATLAPRLAAAADVGHFFLDNGLEVVVVPDHRSPVVTHMIWYKVGSADEEPGKAGVAHFLEHLLFKGTPKHPGSSFSDTVAAIGGSENAFTSYDYTAYYQRVAREHLPLVMEMEADRMTNLILTDDVVARERDVVLEERRSRVENDPGSKLGEVLDATFYLEHPYGRPVIGWMQEIEALDREDALDVYTRYYTPNNAVLVVAGDVEPDEVRALAARTYGEVARRADPPPRIRRAEPDVDAERRVLLRDPSTEQESLRREYHVPSYTTAEPGVAEALDVLGEAFGGGATSRLYRRLVVERKLAAGAGGYYQASALDDTAFHLYAVPADGVDLATLEKAMDEEVADLVANGLDADDIERAKRNIIAEAVYARDSQSAMARIYGTALTTGSTVEAVEGWADAIRAVTPEDVDKAARDWLRIGRSATGWLVRQAPKEPS